MTVIFLTKTLLINLTRQKTIIFGSFILPIVIIWSTWWVTADIPMIFPLDQGSIINASMIKIHVVTGGLTAMGITAALFGFMITTDSQTTSKRLRQVGYSSSTISASIFLALFSILTLTSIIAITLSTILANPVSTLGLAISISFITLIYAIIGHLLGTFYPNITAGSLIVLIFAFIDLMMVTNPMGEDLYLQNWTKFIPGFYPVQIALESGFIGFPQEILSLMINSLIYFSAVLILTLIIKKFRLTIEVKK